MLLAVLLGALQFLRGLSICGLAPRSTPLTFHTELKRTKQNLGMFHHLSSPVMAQCCVGKGRGSVLNRTKVETRWFESIYVQDSCWTLRVTNLRNFSKPVLFFVLS